MAPSHRLRAFLAAALLAPAGALGCQAASGADDASPLGMLDTDNVRISVVTTAGPVHGAVVRILSSVPERGGVAQKSPQLLFEAMTNEAGLATGRYTRASATERVEVIVKKSGFVGPYTDPTRRQARPEFGPASWQVVNPADVADMTISLIPEVQQ